MKKVISASRRTDLPARYPDVLASALRGGTIRVAGPRGGSAAVDLRPESVHTLVLWSKNFVPLLENRFGLRDACGKYDQLYLQFTITGLGGGPLEPGIPPWEEALDQVESLVDLAGDARRVAVRFDPIVFWRGEGRGIRTNLDLFQTIAPRFAAAGVTSIRFSFAQWYRKAVRRARSRGLEFIDPSEEEKREFARSAVGAARESGLSLFSCAQAFLEDVEGVEPSACIDGALLTRLHPRREKAATAWDRSQRTECRCTVSRDIGSYDLACLHPCVYCYAGKPGSDPSEKKMPRVDMERQGRSGR